MTARRAARLAGASALVAGLAVAGPVGPLGPAPAQAASQVENACDAENDQDSPSATPGLPAESMRIPEMQDWFVENRGGRLPGDGVVVAVLDSGVDPTNIPVVAPQQKVAALYDGAQYFHGTAVAGLIAGRPTTDGLRVGIAPGAGILDIKIYDDDDGSDGSVQVSNQTVASGLLKVEELLATQPIRVVNLSVAVPDDPGINTAVRRLWRKGVVVVAAAGNRPGNPDDPLVDKGFGEFTAGENAAEEVFPAGYPDVVATTTTAEGLPTDEPLTSFILQNTATDVAAPSSGALSYAPGGGVCVLKRPATSWATAEVSGVLAALASAYPDESPAQLVTRLEATASGRADVPSPLTGAGVVQAYAAMSRPLVPRKRGYDQTQPVQAQERAEVPPDVPDPLASTRENMVWFGIVGGGVLVLALVLRPVLARRRPR